jgi:hypothetical protein
MWRTITLAIHQRGFALRGGRSVRPLGIGARDRQVEITHELREEVLAKWFAEVHVGVRERGLLSRDAKPAAFSERNPNGEA